MITIGEFEVEFLRIGQGQVKEPILAFHGFGRVIQDFKVFERILKPGQVIYAFHLFQHGKSTFPKERIALDSLTTTEHVAIIDAICKNLNIKTFHLIGYSLGGKIALKTLELLPDRVTGILLIAPDGVKINNFYKFVSGTSLGRAIYRGILKNPKPLFRSADFLRAIRLLPEKLHRFVYFHMESYEKRKLVGEVWMIYRFFDPNIPEIQRIINSKGIRATLIYGKFDRVIQAWQGEKLDAGLDQDSLHILESGHLLLQESTVDYIVEKGIWVSLPSVSLAKNNGG